MQSTTTFINNLTRKERREYFWYLLLLFVIISIGLGCLLFFGVSNPFKMISEADQAVLKQGKLFEDRQKSALVLYDTVLYKVALYKAAPTNVLEADIKQDIKTLNSYYDPRNQDADPRSICFQQMGTFLEMYLGDAMDMRKSIANHQLFQKQLDDCMMGLGKAGEQIRAANPTGH
jgi:hypothetical protein